MARHASYESPTKGNHSCYEPACLMFPSARNLSGLRQMSEARTTQDPDASIDYGTIDSLTESKDRYRITNQGAAADAAPLGPIGPW